MVELALEVEVVVVTSWTLEVVSVASLALMEMRPSPKMMRRVWGWMGMELEYDCWMILRAGDWARLWIGGTTF